MEIEVERRVSEGREGGREGRREEKWRGSGGEEGEKRWT
jgi:hypothetical protein